MRARFGPQPAVSSQTQQIYDYKLIIGHTYSRRCNMLSQVVQILQNVPLESTCSQLWLFTPSFFNTRTFSIRTFRLRLTKILRTY